MEQITPNTNHENHLINAEKIEELQEHTETLYEQLEQYRNSAFVRFPFIFVTLSTFGLVATFYGFEKVIDKYNMFPDNPEMLLGAGILILTVTGTLYKKLS